MTTARKLISDELQRLECLFNEVVGARYDEAPRMLLPRALDETIKGLCLICAFNSEPIFAIVPLLQVRCFQMDNRYVLA